MKNTHPYLSTEERRAGAVQAVVELAGEQNPAEITTAVIAEKMGLTQGALFRHFPTKEAIFESVLSWVSGQLMRRVDRAIQEGGSAREKLERVFLTHTDFVATCPGVPRMIFGQLQRPGRTLPKQIVEKMLTEYGAKLREILETGIRDGEFAQGLDVEAAATLFVGSLQGLVLQSLVVDEPGRIANLAPRVFDLYITGLVGGVE